MSTGDIVCDYELKKAYEEGYAAGLRDTKKWKNAHEEPPERNQRVLYVPTGKERVSAGNYHGQGPRGGHYFMTANHLESAWWWMPPPEMPEGGKHG